MTSMTSMTSSISNTIFCDEAVPMDVDNKHQEAVASKFSDEEIQKICASCCRKNAMACRNKNYPLNRSLLQRNLTTMLWEANLAK